MLLSCLRPLPVLCHRAPECMCGVSVSVRVSWVCLCAYCLVLMQQHLLQWRTLRKRKEDKKKPPSLRHFCLGCTRSLPGLVLVFEVARAASRDVLKKINYPSSVSFLSCSEALGERNLPFSAPSPKRIGLPALVTLVEKNQLDVCSNE